MRENLGTITGKILAAAALCLLTGSALAEVTLRYDPADQTVPPGELDSLSIMLDEPLDVRTVVVRASYDPAVLESVSGQPGALFYATGCQLFPDFQDDTPGEWFGGVAILGADCWLTGPGELYRWYFTGLANGVSDVVTLEVELYDPQANLYEDVSLPPTTVIVSEGTAAPPAPPAPLSLDLAPNPFNPSTRLTLRGEGAARLSVYDVAGRLLAEPWAGELAGWTEVVWDGTDAAGRALPSGVYLFRLSGDGGGASRRGVLLE